MLSSALGARASLDRPCLVDVARPVSPMLLRSHSRSHAVLASSASPADAQAHRRCGTSFLRSPLARAPPSRSLSHKVQAREE